MKTIIGVDPGLAGAFVVLGPEPKQFRYESMPVVKMGKDKDIRFQDVRDFFSYFTDEDAHAFLERAVPFAMGTRSAFNYGRGFNMIENALYLADIPVTYVEPMKWAKVMHAGISEDLKPKVKSQMAVRRLYPQLVKQIPATKTGKLDEGVVDALLIAGYGLREWSKR